MPPSILETLRFDFNRPSHVAQRPMMDEDALVNQFRVLLKEANVNCSTNRDLLLIFLRVRKYDLNRSVKLVKNYLKLLKNSPNLTGDLKPHSLKNAVKQKIVFLNRNRDTHGRRIIFSQIGLWNPNHCSIHEMFRFHVYCLQRLASEVETQKKGLVIVFDVNGLGLHHVRQFSPSVVKSLALILQDSFPMRFQAIHIINEPWIFKMIVSLVWPLLSEKMRNRVFFHGGSIGSLHDQITPDLLPDEYGGSNGSLEEITFFKVIPKNHENKFDLFQ